mmetsp:Transcript_5850/g.10601  ORF Transcript_5850/g.10601 Transcript_5850/m.10601 type:complete len:264 (+) Transcript_5850:255-1046(+)
MCIVYTLVGECQPARVLRILRACEACAMVSVVVFPPSSLCIPLSYSPILIDVVLRIFFVMLGAHDKKEQAFIACLLLFCSSSCGCCCCCCVFRCLYWLFSFLIVTIINRHHDHRYDHDHPHDLVHHHHHHQSSSSGSLINDPPHRHRAHYLGCRHRRVLRSPWHHHHPHHDDHHPPPRPSPNLHRHDHRHAAWTRNLPRSPPHRRGCSHTRTTWQSSVHDPPHDDPPWPLRADIVGRQDSEPYVRGIRMRSSKLFGRSSRSLC